MFQLCQNQMSQTGLVGRILFLFQSKIYRQRSYRLPYSCFNIFLTQQKCHSLQQPKNKNACIIPNKHLNIFHSTKKPRLLKSFSTVKNTLYLIYSHFTQSRVYLAGSHLWNITDSSYHEKKKKKISFHLLICLTQKENNTGMGKLQEW